MGERWLGRQAGGQNGQLQPSAVGITGCKGLPGHCRGQARMSLPSLKATQEGCGLPSRCPQGPGWTAHGGGGGQGLTLPAPSLPTPPVPRPPLPAPPAPTILAKCSHYSLPADIQKPRDTSETCTTPGCVMAGKPPFPPSLPQPCQGARGPP